MCPPVGHKIIQSIKLSRVTIVYFTERDKPTVEIRACIDCPRALGFAAFEL